MMKMRILKYIGEGPLPSAWGKRPTQTIYSCALKEILEVKIFDIISYRT